MKIDRVTIRRYLQPAFLSCVLVLGTSALGMSLMVRSLGGCLAKEPLALRKGLNAMDEQALRPFKVVERRHIQDPDVLQALGTVDYIQWVLEDPNGPFGPQRMMLFVTYYPLPDRVPHVPEECYLGGGFQRLGTETVSFRLPDGQALEARYLIFGASEGYQTSRVPVVYFFRVNGRFAGDRDQARVILNSNLFGRWSYFSKVELVFNLAPMSREQVLDQAQRLLERVVPLLEREHWPIVEERS